MVRLREEVDREREERNFFQLERDKVNTFWEITKRQLDESKSTMRNKERELEDAEEKHQVEIKVRPLEIIRGVLTHFILTQVYKQKVKHLLYEHQNNITELKRDGAVAVTLEQSQHHEKEGELNVEKRSLKVVNPTFMCDDYATFNLYRLISRKRSYHTKKP